VNGLEVSIVDLDASGRLGAAHPAPKNENSEAATEANLCVGRLYMTQEMPTTSSFANCALTTLAMLSQGQNASFAKKKINTT
jgi:hypothetical protein